MDGLIQLLTDNPTLLAVALVLVAVGGYTLVRRMVRPALFLLVLLAALVVPVMPAQYYLEVL